MTKPKNPYQKHTMKWHAWRRGAADNKQESMKSGEKRLSRALRRLMRRQKEWSYVSLIDLDDFLTARQKRGKN